MSEPLCTSKSWLLCSMVAGEGERQASTFLVEINISHCGKVQALLSTVCLLTHGDDLNVDTTNWNSITATPGPDHFLPREEVTFWPNLDGVPNCMTNR